MLSFEEFQAVNNRDQLMNAKTKPTTAVKKSEDKKRAASSTAESKNSSSKGWRLSLGELLELHSLQLLLIVLIVIDTFISLAELAVKVHRLDRIYAIPVQALETFSVSITLIFSTEILLIFFAFGFRTFLHLGYMIDLFVVFTQLYLDSIGFGKESRLLNILRSWRAMRLFNAAIAVEREAQEEMLASVQIVQEDLKQLQSDKDSLRAEISREKEAIAAVENMLQNYKEEVDTLNEALKIAAMDIAEVAQEDDFLSSEDEGSLSISQTKGPNSEDGSGMDKSDTLRAVLGDDIRANHEKVKSTFVVHEDGKYEVK